MAFGTEHETVMSSDNNPQQTIQQLEPNQTTTTTNTTTKKSKTKLKIKIKRYHGIAKWTWGVGDEEDVCIVCQSAFEGVAPGVKYPGDECPVVWGKCGHAFHLQCVTAWLQSQSSGGGSSCPICRREWEFGAEKAVDVEAAVGDGREEG
mmetsp:Transcript_17955/g.37613  ORF Transcript_17955/g.37613 Transcript_17955/m.37613 type:complete len:149 (+) Transcript_17955:247-693(+)